jgi:hypothetical protein
MTKFLVTSAIAAAVFPAALIGCPGGTGVCDPECKADERCSDITNTCVPAGEGEGEGEGEAGIDCSDQPSEGGACLEETPPQLCNGTKCEEPQGLTGGCAAAGGNTVGNEDIVIYGVASDGEGPANGGACTTAYTYFADIYSETDITDLPSLYSEVVKVLNDAGAENLSYSNGADTAFHPAITAVGAAAPNEYLLTFFTCNAFNGALVLKSGGNTNAICAE